MDRLGVLAELERLREAGKAGGDEFRLFLLLLVCYDCGRRRGEINRLAVHAAMGKGVTRHGLDRACCRLAALGLLELLPPFPEPGREEESVMVYVIPPFGKGAGMTGEQTWKRLACLWSMTTGMC